MIKYLGSVGCFVRLNDEIDNTYNLLNIFSSSANSTLLFSASINNFTGQLVFDDSIAESYVNGQSASYIPNNKWSHLTLTFPEKLLTSSNDSFNIRFGDFSGANFNIQNLYIMDSALLGLDPQYLHEEFTGGGAQILRVSDTASYSINVIDYLEDNFTSASNGIVYQPLKNQSRYLCEVVAVKEDSLSLYVSSSVLVNDDLFIDGFNITSGDRVLSLTDNQIYELTASSQLLPISSSVGDFVQVLFGTQYGSLYLLKSNLGFDFTPSRQKIAAFVDISDINNP
jgi:hypothetical protein